MDTLASNASTMLPVRYVVRRSVGNRRRSLHSSSEEKGNAMQYDFSAQTPDGVTHERTVYPIIDMDGCIFTDPARKAVHFPSNRGINLVSHEPSYAILRFSLVLRQPDSNDDAYDIRLSLTEKGEFVVPRVRNSFAHYLMCPLTRKELAASLSYFKLFYRVFRNRTHYGNVAIAPCAFHCFETFMQRRIGCAIFPVTNIATSSVLGDISAQMELLVPDFSVTPCTRDNIYTTRLLPSEPTVQLRSRVLCADRANESTQTVELLDSRMNLVSLP